MKRQFKSFLCVCTVFAIMMTMSTGVYARNSSTANLLSEVITPNPNEAVNALDLSSLSVGTVCTPAAVAEVHQKNYDGTFYECTTANGATYSWKTTKATASSDSGWTVMEDDGGKYLYNAPEYSEDEALAKANKNSVIYVNTMKDITGWSPLFVGGFTRSKLVTQFDFKYDNSDLFKATYNSSKDGYILFDENGTLARFFRAETDQNNLKTRPFDTIVPATDITNAKAGKYTFVSQNFNHFSHNYLEKNSGTEFPFEFGKWYTARIIHDIKNKTIRIYYFDSDGVQINNFADDNYYVYDHIDPAAYDSNTWNTGGTANLSMLVEFGNSNWFPTYLRNVYTVKDQWIINTAPEIVYDSTNKKISATTNVGNNVAGTWTNSKIYFDDYYAGDTTPALILALYDKDTNRLIGVKIKTDSKAGRVDQYYDETGSCINLTAELGDLSNGEYIARAFIWNNLNGLVPYQSAVESDPIMINVE